jgi:predicted amidophosphoribosyltransferase
MTPLRMTELEFGSLLSYSPRGNSSGASHSRNVMIALKTEKFVRDTSGKTLPMSEWVAEKIQRDREKLEFSSFFNLTTMLVPTPKSSLMQPGTLWVPERVASALVEKNLGKRVQPCLTRVRPVPKAATSSPGERPTPLDHYNSLRVIGTLTKPEEIILVDDIITRGATLLGAANRLAEAFPETRIRAFAVMRTVSKSNEFAQLNDPCVGIITLRNSGDTIRRP